MGSDSRNRTMVEADRCIARLNSHPALIHSGMIGFLEGNACPMILQECRRGVAADVDDTDVTVDLWPGDARYDEFRGEFLDPARLDDRFDPLSIAVPYERLHGEPWKLHHCVWAAEYSIFRFKGKAGQSKMPSASDYDAYEAGSAEARTFEDLVIKLHADVVRRYGDFEFGDLLTDEERANHDAEEPFTRERVELTPGSGAWVNKLHGNPLWVVVNKWDLNLRWWDWFRTTDEHRERFESE